MTFRVTQGHREIAESAPFEVLPGANEVTVELRPVCWLRVVLTRDGEPTSVGGAWSFARATQEGGGRSTDSHLMLWGEHPVLMYPFDGPCQVDLRRIAPELAHVEPARVVLRHGEEAVLRIELTAAGGGR
jgi:hypothetical protein